MDDKDEKSHGVDSELKKTDDSTSNLFCRELCLLFREAEMVDHTIAFIGGGKIAASLLKGFHSCNLFSKKSVAIGVHSELSKQRWNAAGYENVFTDNLELLSKFGGSVVVLAVQPQKWRNIASELSHMAFSKTQLIISVMAGVSLEELEASLPNYNRGFIRLMPNTPVACGAGTFILCADKAAAKKVSLAKFLASKLGVCVEVCEESFNAATAVAGCGPAFIYTVIDAMADGGVVNGLKRSDAIKLAAQCVLGAAKMVLDSEEHPAKLKDNVCTPAGATIAGIRALEQFGIRHSLIEAVCASTDRINQL